MNENLNENLEVVNEKTSVSSDTNVNNTNAQETSNASAEDNKSANIDVEESNNDDNVDFDEDDEEQETLSNTKNDENHSQKQKQHSNKNKRYAEMRRKGFLDAIDTNPYTNEKIETDEDISVYKTMKRMEKEGLDPLNTSDYIKFSKKLEQEKLEKIANEEKQKRELEQKTQAQINKDLTEFNQKYSDVNFTKWLNSLPSDINNSKNEDLKSSYIQDKKATIKSFISSGMTLTQAYEMFNRLTNVQVNERAEKIATQKIQNHLSSPGSQTNDENTRTSIDWKTASDDVFKKELEKVIRGY